MGSSKGRGDASRLATENELLRERYISREKAFRGELMNLERERSDLALRLERETTVLRRQVDDANRKIAAIEEEMAVLRASREAAAHGGRSVRIPDSRFGRSIELAELEAEDRRLREETERILLSSVLNRGRLVGDEPIGGTRDDERRVRFDAPLDGHGGQTGRATRRVDVRDEGGARHEAAASARRDSVVDPFAPVEGPQDFSAPVRPTEDGAREHARKGSVSHKDQFAGGSVLGKGDGGSIEAEASAVPLRRTVRPRGDAASGGDSGWDLDVDLAGDGPARTPKPAAIPSAGVAPPAGTGDGDGSDFCDPFAP